MGEEETKQRNKERAETESGRWQEWADEGPDSKRGRRTPQVVRKGLPHCRGSGGRGKWGAMEPRRAGTVSSQEARKWAPAKIGEGISGVLVLGSLNFLSLKRFFVHISPAGPYFSSLCLQPHYKSRPSAFPSPSSISPARNIPLMRVYI